VLHPSHFLGNALYSLIGYNGFTLIDIYKTLLNLPIKTKPNINLHFSPELTKNAEKRFYDYGLIPQKTIIIAPHANSVNENFISLEFWTDIIEYCKTKNYSIAALTGDAKYLNLGMQPIDFPLSESIPFLNMCHSFISLRSGLCDLVGTAECNKIVLYPKLQWYSGSLIEGSSIKKMAIAKNNLHEIEITSNNDSSKIIELL
jgi:hypothetical protein